MESTSEVRPEVVAPESGRLAARVVGLFRGGLRELMVATEKRVPFLDGLRAAAVLLVINAHVANVVVKHNGPNRYTNFPLTRNGWMGVDLFFVLSGYFIGSQLWRELGKTGTVSIKQFMIRRGLRIWPLYFFVFAVVFLYSPAAAAAKEYGWTDIAFLTNYLNHGIVQGSWSLCTEEQFYLLAPAALLLIGRRSMRGYRWGLGALLVAALVARGITFYAITGHLLGKDEAAWTRLYYPFHTHCDGLIAGLIVANLAATKERFGGLLARPGLLVGLSAVLVVALTAVRSDLFQFTGLAIFFASLVWWGLASGTTWLGQHIFYLLSRLSFGMYLNHEYFAVWIVTRLEPALGFSHLNPMMGPAAGFLLLTGLSMALSAVTFCVVEHPFLVLRTVLLQRSVPHLTAH